MSLNSNERKPMDRLGAWLCLLANVIALPGLGSIIAGKRVGYAQALLALAGFGLTGYGRCGSSRPGLKRVTYRSSWSGTWCRHARCRVVSGRVGLGFRGRD